MLSPFANGVKVDSERFFFLFVSCSFLLLSISELLFPDWGIFYMFRPLHVDLVTLSCGAGRKEIRKFGGGRV